MKKILQCILVMILSVTGLYAQSYSEYLSKAKQYENQKKWCYALGAYYDAMGTDETPESKKEAFEGYKALKDSISSGNPGLGKYNQFTFHDEWKNLLMDAEQYGSCNNLYEITIGELEQGDLDYSTRTATYNAKVSFQKGDRYKYTIKPIEEGYKKAYKEDWKDLPKEWPLYSVSSQQNNNYNVSGALVYAREMKSSREDKTCYLNAFAMLDSKKMWMYSTPGLYDYKFNIVDENGKEIVKSKRWLLDESDTISFSGISPEMMNLIDNKKAFINPVACYLEYGKYNSADSNGGRTFIKNFPEVQLPLRTEEFICGENKKNKISINVSLAMINNIIYLKMVPIGKIEIMMTEVTQEMWEAIMNYYPEEFVGTDLPVVNISWYDAIEFCNKLSELQGYTPAYFYDKESKKVTQNPDGDGYRLPTVQEWVLASGRRNSEINYSDIGWFYDNSEDKIHPVAQKKANEYGLFDMYGNVREWCWDDYNEIPNNPGKKTKGGSFAGGYYETGTFYAGYIMKSYAIDIGFRVVRTVSEKQ